MAQKRKPLTFPELDDMEPKGKHAILRTPDEIAAEQALLEHQDAHEQPAEAEEPTPGPEADGAQQKPSRRRSSRGIGKGTAQNRESANVPATTNRASYQKATYRLSPEALEAIEDAKRILRRQHSIKVNLEEIAEEAILAAYRDLEKNKQASNLVNKFAGKRVKQKSRTTA